MPARSASAATMGENGLDSRMRTVSGVGCLHLHDE